jgi:hypothetical protein
MNAPYEFGKRYGWIVNAHRPGQPPSKPLLRAQIARA